MVRGRFPAWHHNSQGIRPTPAAGSEVLSVTKEVTTPQEADTWPTTLQEVTEDKCIMIHLSDTVQELTTFDPTVEEHGIQCLKWWHFFNHCLSAQEKEAIPNDFQANWLLPSRMIW